MPRTQLVLTNIPQGGGGAGSKLQFPSQPDLDGCLIVGFEMFSADQSALTPDRVPVLPAAEVVNVSVTLNTGADKRFWRMPMSSLIAAGANAGVFRQCDPFFCDWQKSQYEFGAAVTVNTALVMQVQYLRPEDAPEMFKAVRGE